VLQLGVDHLDVISDMKEIDGAITYHRALCRCRVAVVVVFYCRQPATRTCEVGDRDSNNGMPQLCVTGAAGAPYLDACRCARTDSRLSVHGVPIVLVLLLQSGKDVIRRYISDGGQTCLRRFQVIAVDVGSVALPEQQWL
jgi:hypothetical protein